MNTWLVGFGIEINGTEIMVYFLTEAVDLTHAEAGIAEMGRTWWPALEHESDGYRWEYPGRVIWFNSIILLDDVENNLIRGLKFLDVWRVNGTSDAPVLCDEYGNNWLDITR